MLIVKLRVKNYRSIKDSGYCYPNLEDNITIFAGKNESGKTAILEALEDFDVNKSIREKAIPIKEPEAIPEISLAFEVENKKLREIFSEIDFKPPEVKKLILEIIKKYPNRYYLSKETLAGLGIDIGFFEKNQKLIKAGLKKISALQSTFPQIKGEGLPEFRLDNIQEFKTKIKAFKDQITPDLNQIPDEKKRDKLIKEIENLINILSEIEKIESFEKKFIEEIKKWIPNFILFSGFDDIFPSEITLEKALKNSLIKDLDVISNLDLDLIRSDNIIQKTKHKEQLNIRMKEEYGKYWTQDLTNLHIDWDSEKLFFFIKEGNDFYPPDMRSKGKQWHLAFYIRVSARSEEDVPNIILIDEPGLFLHAEAQKDVLKKLEDSAKTTQILFATHSPYLIDPQKLNRIRLLFRDEKRGTIIENKIHKLSDKETLTPILTAIGLELSSGISNLDKLNNVVVEGPSDWYYLQAFKKFFKAGNINFVFGGGAGNMAFVGTILSGWGCRVLYLYDNDQGKKDGERNLKKNWLVSKEDILAVIDVKGGRIEEIFEKDDFKKYVLRDEKVDYDCKNSEYIKKTGKDKVLLAKLFLESSDKVKLSASTKERIEKILKSLQKRFQK